MGGYGLDSCEFYDIIKDQWTQFQKLNENNRFGSASILNNKFIYLFGGYHRNIYLDTI